MLKFSKFLLLAFTGMLFTSISYCQNNNSFQETHICKVNGDDFPAPLKTVTVSNSSELFSAVNYAVPGTHIILNDGVYTSEVTISGTANEDAPIVIRSKNLLGARFTESVKLTGSYIIVSGIYVDGPGMILSGNYNRISRCRIHFGNLSGACVQVEAGRGGRVDRCEMTVKGDDLDTFLTKNTWYFRSGVNMSKVNHPGLLIDRNYFRDWPSKSSSSPYSSSVPTIIRIGSIQPDSVSEGQAIVEYNLFEDCHKTSHYMSKCIHFKCSGNIARFNTVIDSERSLIDSRTGWGNTFYGNYMENSGGIHIFDADNEVTGNVIINGTVGIEVYAGDVTEYKYADTRQARSYNTLLAGNISNKLVIGEKWSHHVYPALNTMVEAHTGPVEKKFEEGTVIREITSRQIPAAVKLKRNMVGPDAPGDNSWSVESMQVPMLPSALRTIKVYNPTQFQSALADARAGDHIVLADGVYSGSFGIDKTAAPDNPIVILSDNLNQAIITGKLTVEGAYIQVWKIKFHGPDARMEVSGNRHKVIACWFEGWGSGNSSYPALGLPKRNDHLEIAYCMFTKPAGLPSFTPQGEYPLRIGIRGRHRLDLDQVSFDTHIHHNYFVDFPKKQGSYHSGQSDAIEIAPVFIDADTRWIIEYNLFEDIKSTDGSIIDVKSGRKDLVQYNTAVNCNGRMDIRSSQQTTMQFNWLENTKGIAVLGAEHKLIGNHVLGGGSIVILKGNGVGPSTTGYDQVKNCLLRCNVGTLRIGLDWSSTGVEYPPVNTTVEGHNPGNISWGIYSGRTFIPDYSCSPEQAFKLTPAQVGPGALP